VQTTHPEPETTMSLFQTFPNRNIKHTAVALIFSDFSEYVTGATTRIPIEEGLRRGARQCLGTGQYDPRFHELLHVEWEDGTWSWASFRWQKGLEQSTLYLLSAAGGTMLTARFVNEDLATPEHKFIRRRVKVVKRRIGTYKGSPLYVLRVRYNDGLKTWQLSGGGHLAMFGGDRAWMNRTAREYLAAS
jgi:hypothetical protein